MVFDRVIELIYEDSRMNFSLRQLSVFVTLAKTQHFGRAADLLQISQPTVSADIRSMERTMSIRLFTRSRAGTTLTDAGRALLPLARDVIERAEALADQARELAREPDGIRLAATPSLINFLIPKLLHELDALQIGVRVDVIEVPTGRVEEALAADEADIGIGHFVRSSPHTERIQVADDEVCVITDREELDPTASANFRLLQRRKLLIWPRNQHPEYYDALVEACQQRGLDPEILETSGALSGAQSYLLRNGQAFSLVPFDFARESSPSLSFAPLEPPMHIPLQAIWTRPPSPAVTEVVSSLRRARSGVSTQRAGHRGSRGA